MASNYTSNYGLCQWQASDKVLRTEFNADNAKIDAAIAAVDSRVDGKASTSALNSLKTTVNGKASQSDLDSLSATVSGLKTGKADKSALDSLSSIVSQHTSALAGKGNCQLYTTTYTGSGTYGETSQNSLTFPKKPMVVFLAGPLAGTRGVLVQGQDSGFCSQMSGGVGQFFLTWSGNSVRWYNHKSSSGQMNESGKTYIVVALLKAD